MIEDQDPAPLLRPGLLTNGLLDSDIRVRQGIEWSRIRRGAYYPASEWETLDHERQHRVLLAATSPRLIPESVISHLSAAVLHGRPVVGQLIGPVHITRQQSNGGFVRGCVHSHVGHLEPGEVVTIDGLRVTSLLRTLFDCARTASFDTAVVLIDNALALELVTKADLAAMITRRRRLHGLRKAREAIAFADPRSESPGESIGRIRIAQHELPEPRLQYEIRRHGVLVARVDFAWPQFRTFGEFDGAIKYTTLLKPGESAEDVLERQQARQHQLRELGWKPVRWGWADHAQFDPIAALLRSTFARAA